MMKGASIYIDDTGALTPTDVRARARRLKREHGLDLIVLDYLQLMQVTGTKENRATEISEISRSLKALAKELQVPVIALSQLNRSVEQRNDKKPVMSDLRESGAIEQDADLIMMIYRDEVYDKNTTRKGIADIIIAKQRNGEIGEFQLTFLGQFTQFENFAPEISLRRDVVSSVPVVTVDAAALRNNLAVVRRFAPAARVIAAVKANAYGHGLVHAARALAERRRFRRGARRGRARAASRAASRIRSSCSKACSAASQLEAAAAHDLQLVVHSFEQIAMLEQYAGTHRFAVWLKVDTGMNRLGFRPEEFAAAHARDCSAARAVGTLRLLTHLACAENVGGSETKLQLDRFRALSEPLRLERSIANSAGIIAWPRCARRVGAARA